MPYGNRVVVQLILFEETVDWFRILHFKSKPERKGRRTLSTNSQSVSGCRGYEPEELCFLRNKPAPIFFGFAER